MKKFIFSIFCSCMAMAVNAESLSNGHFDIRAGWSAGGIMPLGMPESIRSLNDYRLKANVQVGIDYEHKFTEKWGVELGMNFENKSMETDAEVKNYRMTMRKGEDEVSGVFTGNVVTEAGLFQLALPLRATFWASKKVKVKFGPYVAFAFCTADGFKGYAYDGYLREGDPTGAKVELGNTPETRGEYDFGNDLRSVNWGLDLGADWYIGKKLGLYADLTWGLNGAFHSNFKTIEQTMYPIFGTIGAVYRIK